MEYEIKRISKLSKILYWLSEFTGFYLESAQVQTSMRVNTDTGEYVVKGSRIMIKASSPFWPFGVRVYLTNEDLEEMYTGTKEAEKQRSQITAKGL